MNDKFSPLYPTPEELERLALLAEECSEVIHMIGKILRFGWNDLHPDYLSGPDNRQRLRSEIADVLAIIELMSNGGDLTCGDAVTMADLRYKKMQKLKKYTQYQSKLLGRYYV